MNLKKRKQIAKTKSFLFNSVLDTAESGSISNSDNGIYIKTNGIFRMLQITYKGEPFITNTLPDGYSISMNTTKIIIMNLLNKPIKKSVPLFSYSGNLAISSASIFNLRGEQIILNNVDFIKTNLISDSNTKVEDDSLIILEDNTIPPMRSHNKRGIDSRIIKGLYTNNPFPDGYVGRYNYDPDYNLYTTAKYGQGNQGFIKTTEFKNTSPKAIKNIKESLKRDHINLKLSADMQKSKIRTRQTKTPRQILKKSIQTTKTQPTKKTDTGGKY